MIGFRLLWQRRREGEDSAEEVRGPRNAACRPAAEEPGRERQFSRSALADAIEKFLIYCFGRDRFCSRHVQLYFLCKHWDVSEELDSTGCLVDFFRQLLIETILKVSSNWKRCVAERRLW